jgi:hypothetical protein
MPRLAQYVKLPPHRPYWLESKKPFSSSYGGPPRLCEVWDLEKDEEDHFCWCLRSRQRVQAPSGPGLDLTRQHQGPTAGVGYQCSLRRSGFAAVLFLNPSDPGLRQGLTTGDIRITICSGPLRTSDPAQQARAPWTSSPPAATPGAMCAAGRGRAKSATITRSGSARQRE